MTIIKREFKRKTGLRDAKLFVIAAEGLHPEKTYFDNLSESLKLSNVHIEFLIRTETQRSAPKHVIRELDKFKRKYSLNSEDELIMVVDFDKWQNQLPQVAQLCLQKKYSLVVSNPSFEIWLLLHFEEIGKPFKSEISTASDLKKYISDTHACGPKNLGIKDYIGQGKLAISRGEKLDLNPNDRWPLEIGTHMYRLIKKLFEPFI